MLFGVLLFLNIAAALAGGGSIRANNLQKALNLADMSRGGLDKSYNNEIIQIMEQIGTEEQIKMKKKSLIKQSLQGKWKLIWTTEKEINFFSEWPFSPSSYVGQSIDFNTKRIENTIEFEDGGYFNVEGVIKGVDEASKALAFTFTAARIKNPLFQFSAPPLGSGSFKTLYVNERYRLSKELSRTDYSILERVIVPLHI